MEKTITNTFKTKENVTVREHGKPHIELLTKRLLELSFRQISSVDQHKGA